MKDPDQFKAIIPNDLPKLSPQQQEDYRRFLSHDPVGLIREDVRECRSSSNRREGFAAAVDYCNEHNCWGPGEPQRTAHELVRDVETRWSTVYNMIFRFMLLWQVFRNTLIALCITNQVPLFRQSSISSLPPFPIRLPHFSPILSTVFSNKFWFS